MPLSAARPPQVRLKKLTCRLPASTTTTFLSLWIFFRPLECAACFSGFFRPLPPPFGPVDDQAGRRSVCRAGSGEGTGVAEDGQQAPQPVIHLRPAEAKDFRQESLQGVGLEVDQQEQQLLFR